MVGALSRKAWLAGAGLSIDISAQRCASSQWFWDASGSASQEQGLPALYTKTGRFSTRMPSQCDLFGADPAEPMATIASSIWGLAMWSRLASAVDSARPGALDPHIRLTECCGLRFAPEHVHTYTLQKTRTAGLFDLAQDFDPAQDFDAAHARGSRRAVVFGAWSSLSSSGCGADSYLRSHLGSRPDRGPDDCALGNQCNQ